MDSERINGNNSMPQDNSSWDAQRLVKEYMKVAWMANDNIPFENIPLGNQIRLQRVASTICAFMNWEYKKDKTLEIINCVFDCYGNKEVHERSKVSDQKLARLKTMLCESSAEDWKTEHLLKQFNINSDREQMMRMLVRYRISAEDLLGTFSGVIEARVGSYIGIQAVRDIYNPVLLECNNKIDNMIVILLGDCFDKSFTERELIERYNYPTMTDSELLDWEIDNL